MGTHGSGRGPTSPVCSRSRHLNFSPPRSKPATTMSPGGGRVGGAGGGRNKNTPPQGVHPRYIPKRGSVLKGIVRDVLRCFLLASSPASGPASSGDRRVCPVPTAAGGDGAEPGK